MNQATITAADVKGEGDGEDEESKDEERVEETEEPPWREHSARGEWGAEVVQEEIVTCW